MNLQARFAAATKAVAGVFSDGALNQAAAMLSGILPGGMGTPPARGVQDFLLAYKQSPWLRAVAGRISTSVAETEWQLFVLRKPGGRARHDQNIQHASKQYRRRALTKAAKEGELEQLTDHPLLTALHGGNSMLTGQSMRKVTQLHIDLVGEGFWLKERDPLGVTIAFWPIPPHWLIALPTPAFPFYRASFRGWKGQIPMSEIVSFIDPDPWNPYGRGTGTAMSLGDELETDEYACHDESTECLTRRGWVASADLSTEDYVGVWNEQAQTIQYEQPTEIQRYPHVGLMQHWKTDRVDALVTPNHRMWLRVGDGDDWRFIRSGVAKMSRETAFTLRSTTAADVETVPVESVYANDITSVMYSGDVWCVTVPSGTVVTRRNGCTLVSGNSKHLKSFFYNRARPDLIVWPKGGTLNPNEVKRVEQDWLSKNQGFFRAFKPYFLSREVEVKELDQNFKSLTMVPIREFERNAVLQTYGMPPEILGVLSSSNRATISAADFLMATYIVEPRLETMRSVIQERVTPEYDERIIVEYPSPVKEDGELMLETAKAFPWALSMDEARAMMKHQAMADPEAGAMRFVPKTSTPMSVEKMLEKATAADPVPPPLFGRPASPPAIGHGSDGHDSTGVEPGASGSETHAPTDGKALRLVTRVAPRWRDAWKADILEQVAVASSEGDRDLEAELAKGLPEDETSHPVVELAASAEPVCVKALQSVWRAHRRDISLATIERILDGSSAPEGAILTALALPKLAAAQTAALRPIFLRSVLRGASFAADGLEAAGFAVERAAGTAGVAVDFAAINPAAVAWAQAHAAELVADTADVKELIREFVALALDEGIAPAELARLIREVIGLTTRQATAVAAFNAQLFVAGVADVVRNARVERYAEAQRRARAMTIARTELMSATNAGQQILWTQAIADGVLVAAQFDKTWIVTPDDLLCHDPTDPNCEDQDGAIAAITEPFDVGVEYPPLHPNCRCTFGLVNKVTRRALARRTDKESFAELVRPLAENITALLGRDTVVEAHIHLPPAAPVYVEAPTVTVEAPNVAAPNVDVHVAAAPIPNVDVHVAAAPAPNVDVHVPATPAPKPRKKLKMRLVTDKKGRIVGSEEQD